ncbi:hypothetical protein N9M57_03215 [Opitutales bacterium]|nr:hypothetical protein [Opitutales bacterium]
MPKLPADYLKLLITAAFYHDCERDRRLIFESLQNWLSKQGNVLDADAIRSCIAAETGTDLEPFRLEEQDLNCAVFLAQITFCQSVGQSRFTIVSRDTIGDRGGLVLTNNLKATYTERYIYGKNRWKQKSGWKFTPSLIDGFGNKKAITKKANIRADDDGFAITIKGFEIDEKDLPSALRAYQKDARIEGLSSTLSELGIRIDYENHAIRIASGSPESIIRLMPSLLDESLLILRADDLHRYPLIALRLGMPDEEPLKLNVFQGDPPGKFRWLRCSELLGYTLSDEIIHAVGRWCRPHNDWYTHFTKLL